MTNNSTAIFKPTDKHRIWGPVQVSERTKTTIYNYMIMIKCNKNTTTILDRSNSINNSSQKKNVWLFLPSARTPILITHINLARFKTLCVTHSPSKRLIARLIFLLQRKFLSSSQFNQSASLTICQTMFWSMMKWLSEERQCYWKSAWIKLKKKARIMIN